MQMFILELNALGQNHISEVTHGLGETRLTPMFSQATPVY